MAEAIQSLPYRPDSSTWFEALAGRHWAVFLDSGRPGSARGRFDILSAAPRATLMTQGLETEIRDPDGTRLSLDDPFALLRECLGPRRPAIPGLPFQGGAIGYFAYDLGRRLERLPSLAADEEPLPDMAIGLYDWALVVDHVRRRTTLVARDAALAQYWRERLEATSDQPRPLPAGDGFSVLGPIRSNLSASAYRLAFEGIASYLLEGDCYQVNLAQRFTAPAEGDAWPAYRRLRAANPVPFGAYLALPQCRILSISPERFLRLRGDRVETKPIKGTRPRGRDAAEDARAIASLLHSPKDRAENLMIVDLLRNDLGKVCAIGSVRVPRLFAVETYARVHHLVSTVRGRLAPGRDATDLLRACFPGGSITGAPKRRAMEIIDELEPHRRGVYCGAIGYLGYDGAMDTNIAIRTLVHANGIAHVWAGGGIVADSDPEAEYRETYHKAAPLLDLLEGSRLDRVVT